MTPAEIKADYIAMLNERGETIVVRRYSTSGSPPERTATNIDVRGVVVGYEPKEFIGAIIQGDRRAILLADDLDVTAFNLPLKTSDKLVVRGKEMAIIAVDDSTRRVLGELIAYELQVRA